MKLPKKQSTGGLIFSNMHEGYIGELTSMRSCGSVPFGGRYRLIDFPLSCMVDAGIDTVGVITKSNYKSLMDHLGIGRDWDLARKRGGLVLLPPFAAAGSGMYHGRMEAIINSREFIARSGCDRFVLTDCNYVCNFDINALLEYHSEKKADITCVYQNRHLVGNERTDCTVLDLSDGRVSGIRFEPNTDGAYNTSLNIMIMSRDFLLNAIDSTQGRGVYHFEREYLQPRVKDFAIYGYELSSTALRIGSMVEYYDANMALLDGDIRRSLFGERPIFTKVRDEMPVRYGLDAETSNSLIADGCDIGGSVAGSVLFRGVTVGAGAKVRNCVLMQGCTVGEGAAIEGVVCDKDTVISPGRVLVGCASNPLFVPKGSTV